MVPVLECQHSGSLAGLTAGNSQSSKQQDVCAEHLSGRKRGRTSLLSPRVTLRLPFFSSSHPGCLCSSDLPLQLPDWHLLIPGNASGKDEAARKKKRTGGQGDGGRKRKEGNSAEKNGAGRKKKRRKKEAGGVFGGQENEKSSEDKWMKTMTQQSAREGRTKRMGGWM